MQKPTFFDLKKTQTDEPYLVITESRFKGEGRERERNSISIFSDHAQDFLIALQETIKKLK